MIVRSLGGLGVVMVLGVGCSSSTAMSEDDQPPGDATPTVQYERFVSSTWSLAVVDGRVQLSITDQQGDAACALGVDQRNHLTGAGGQIILQLPGTATEVCPQDSYTLIKCSNEMGSDAFVPAGCAYYRQFDATGHVVGVAPALNATVQIAGTANDCALRVNVGFYGASFNETFSLQQNPGTQPWCNGPD